MSRFILQIAAVVCLLIFLSGKCSANFWRPAVESTLPPNPDDDYYQTFQTVPPANKTATKLLTNFLRIPGGKLPLGRRKRQTRIEDIVVVLDGSGSIGRCEFGKGKKALKQVMKLAEKNPTVDTKYAAVSYSNIAVVDFKFLPYSTAANDVMQIGYVGGGTNTQDGLEKAKRLFEDPSSGRRVISRKMVLLVTDGQSNSRDLTISKAKALKGIGIDIYVVAVGSHINGIDEMVNVASSPPENHMFRVQTLGDFWQVVKLAIRQVNPGEYAVLNGQYDPPC